MGEYSITESRLGLRLLRHAEVLEHDSGNSDRGPKLLLISLSLASRVPGHPSLHIFFLSSLHKEEALKPTRRGVADLQEISTGYSCRVIPHEGLSFARCYQKTKGCLESLLEKGWIKQTNMRMREGVTYPNSPLHPPCGIKTAR